MNLFRTLARAHRRNRARRELMSLGEGALKDIGVWRADIDAVVEGLMRGSVRAPHRASAPAANTNANRPRVAA